MNNFKVSVICIPGFLLSMFVVLSTAFAGPLYDNYYELKGIYPQFFQRLLDTKETNDTQIRDWLGEIDFLLSGNYEVINNTNFSSELNSILINTYLMPEHKAVWKAITAAYTQELSAFLADNGLSGDLAGFYYAVKDVFLDSIVVVDPRPDNLLNNNEPVMVSLNGSLFGVGYYYTLDGSEPTTLSGLYNGAPIGVSQIAGPKTLKVIAAKNNTTGDVFDFTYARCTVNGVVRQEATELRRARVFLELDGKEYDASVDSQGNFLLNSVPAGNRIFRIVSEKYLPVRIQVKLEPGQAALLPEYTMRAGDLNGDGKIELADLGVLSTSYGKKMGGDSAYDAADINEDGIVDLVDLGWLATNYGMSAD